VIEEREERYFMEGARKETSAAGRLAPAPAVPSAPRVAHQRWVQPSSHARVGRIRGIEHARCVGPSRTQMPTRSIRSLSLRNGPLLAPIFPAPRLLLILASFPPSHAERLQAFLVNYLDPETNELKYMKQLVRQDGERVMGERAGRERACGETSCLSAPGGEGGRA
jgi:hypothetical protein